VRLQPGPEQEGRNSLKKRESNQKNMVEQNEEALTMGCQVTCTLAGIQAFAKRVTKKKKKTEYQVTRKKVETQTAGALGPLHTTSM